MGTEPEAKPPDHPRRRADDYGPRRIGQQPWWVIVILTAVPTFITSYFTYRASAVASQAKAAEAQHAAEDGYEEMVKAVETLQKHDDDYVRAIADLNGHIKAIEAMMVTMRPHVDERTRETHLEITVPAGVRDKRNWHPSFPAPVKTSNLTETRVAVPQSLGEAAAAKK